MLAIVGTVPYPDLPIREGQAHWREGRVEVGGERFEARRGTPALLAAACATCSRLGLPAPYAFLVGDEGKGKGSRALYRRLTEVLPRSDYTTLAFHYLLPDVDWHAKILFAIDEMPRPPRLIADAGFMYAAKMSGQANRYDLFTPDAGELAFLADELAPHPFYTRGFVLHEGQRAPDLIRRAYAGGNAALCLLVKGSTDHVANAQGVVASLSAPSIEAMEAIGGTGDTLTGIAAGLVEAGIPVEDACLVAAKTNRLAGELARLNPGSSIDELVAHIPNALKKLNISQ